MSGLVKVGAIYFTISGLCEKMARSRVKEAINP